MITLNNEKTGEVREYTCDFLALKELALANVECLMHIALAEHIEAMGGERRLLDLMNLYVNLYERLRELELTARLEKNRNGRNRGERRPCRLENRDADTGHQLSVVPDGQGRTDRRDYVLR